MTAPVKLVNRETPEWIPVRGKQFINNREQLTPRDNNRLSAVYTKFLGHSIQIGKGNP